MNNLVFVHLLRHKSVLSRFDVLMAFVIHKTLLYGQKVFAIVQTFPVVCLY